MAFIANVLKVIIASPGDVSDERKVVTDEIYRWNDANATARQLILLPVKWETHSTPQMGGHPQDIINRQLLEDADIVIGIFGTRIGTPTNDYVSGTVEEIKKHVARGKTAKVYFSDVPIPPSQLNSSQYALVQEFREECRSTGLYATFDSAQEFAREFGHHLDIELNQPRYRWLEAPSASRSDGADLSPDALRLIRAAATTDDGTLILQSDLSGYGLRIGEEEFIDGTGRSVARWKAAIRDLEDAAALDLVSDGVYRVTDVGYRLADAIDENSEAAVSPFDVQQKTHIHELVDGLIYQQRDFLRLLLLKGGSARSDVLHRAWSTSLGGFDWNGVTRPLVEGGLVAILQDLTHGHADVTVNESLVRSLKLLLFPRSEGGKPSAFNGV